MANSSLQEWLLILPDFEDALPRRLQVRPQHLEGLKARVDSGAWVSGGATLHNPLAEGKDKEFSGSYIVARAASKDAVLQEVKKDIYYTSRVWNLEKAQILPVCNACLRHGSTDHMLPIASNGFPHRSLTSFKLHWKEKTINCLDRQLLITLEGKLRPTFGTIDASEIIAKLLVDTPNAIIAPRARLL